MAAAMAASTSERRATSPARPSMSPSPTRRAAARRMRQANAAYSGFSTTRSRRLGVKAALTAFPPTGTTWSEGPGTPVGAWRAAAPSASDMHGLGLVRLATQGLRPGGDPLQVLIGQVVRPQADRQPTLVQQEAHAPLGGVDVG